MSDEMHTIRKVDYTVSAYEEIQRNNRVRVIAVNILDSFRDNEEISDIILADNISEKWGLFESEHSKGVDLTELACGLALYHLKYHPEEEPRIVNSTHYETERTAATAIRVSMSHAVPKFVERGGLFDGTFPLYTERPFSLEEYSTFTNRFFESLIIEYTKKSEPSPEPPTN